MAHHTKGSSWPAGRASRSAGSGGRGRLRSSRPVARTSAALPVYFAARCRPAFVAFPIIVNAARQASSIDEMGQVGCYHGAGEFGTREFHEAFESNHIGDIHEWSA